MRRCRVASDFSRSVHFFRDRSEAPALNVKQAFLKPSTKPLALVVVLAFHLAWVAMSAQDSYHYCTVNLWSVLRDSVCEALSVFTLNPSASTALVACE